MYVHIKYPTPLTSDAGSTGIFGGTFDDGILNTMAPLVHNESYIICNSVIDIKRQCMLGRQLEGTLVRHAERMVAHTALLPSNPAV